MRLKMFLLFAWLFLLPFCVKAQSFSALFYNVENLFYPENDSLEGDNDFCPEGVRHWTWNRYHQKLNSIAKLIRASNAWEAPDFVCLCEIECREVLEDLTNHALLRDVEYGIIHRESIDHRGMDVTILFRKDRMHLLDEQFRQVRMTESGQMNTRDIVIGTFLVDADTLMLAMNHWVSKYGGAYESEEKRLVQAMYLGRLFDSIADRHPNYFLVAGGDFNDDEDSYPIHCFLDQSDATRIVPDGGGSYKYHGKWSFIDHVFALGSFDGEMASLKVLSFDSLLEKDEKYRGQKPCRTYIGYQYHGGISDHLPLLFSYELKEH